MWAAAKKPSPKPTSASCCEQADDHSMGMRRRPEHLTTMWGAGRECRHETPALVEGQRGMYTDTNSNTEQSWVRSPTRWVGWIFFAALMMFVSGVFDIIWGIVGLARDEVFLSGPNGNVVDLDYTTWGWINLIVGVVLVLGACALFTGSLIGRLVALLVAVLSTVANLLVIGAYPIWSVIVITLDVLVIYAIAVHGDEVADSPI
jgi:hypothetical protein